MTLASSSFRLDLCDNASDRPTGRIALPNSVARNRQEPQSKLRDPVEWHYLWLQVRSYMSTINQDGQIDVPFYRKVDTALCV